MLLWIQSILQGFAALMISPLGPPAGNPDWKVVQEWKQEGPLLVMAAESQTIPERCRVSLEHKLVTPILVQGGNQIFADGSLVFSTVDRAFKSAGNLYNVARVPCSLLKDAKVVRWEAFTQTHSLAKLQSFPTIVPSNIGKFFDETANVLVTGTLIGLGIVCTLLFYGKVPASVIVSFLLTAICYGINFACWVPKSFVIDVSQSYLQRVSDTFLWLGFASYGWLLYQTKHCPFAILLIFVASCLIGIIGPIFGATLDQSQATQSIPFIVGYLFLFGILFSSKFRFSFATANSRKEIFRTVAVLIFIITSINDISITQYGVQTIPILPFGTLAGVGLLALSVNDRIVETYEERDFLRVNLEQEVARKTEALRKQSAELETALHTLKATQADLVQSAKLASLGTLSAGIAHEINNALNFVNGSIEPLANLIKKEPFGELERTKSNKLIGLMREGLQLTFGIIVNLKRHTSTSGTIMESVSPREVAEGVILLLKSRLNGFEVVNEIPADLVVSASQVGLSQVLVNLMSNSADAITERVSKIGGSEKRISLSAEVSDGATILTVADTGMGIPKQIQERIFDPFFSTKEVGKGTGLGLHIVLSEMKKYGGSVKVDSEEGKGTKFKLVFPTVARVTSDPKAGAA